MCKTSVHTVPSPPQQFSPKVSGDKARKIAGTKLKCMLVTMRSEETSYGSYGSYIYAQM